MESSRRHLPPTTSACTLLRATIAVEPSPAVGCAIVSRTKNAVDVSQNRSPNGICRGTATVCEDDETEPLYVAKQAPETCVCSILETFNCVYSIDAVEQGTLVISVTIEERTLLSQLVAELRDGDASVTLRQLTPFGDEKTEATEIDTTAITEKQREAAELAVNLGYYDRPREATLTELADQLEVSESAVSQRLNAIESRVVSSLVDT